MAGKNEKVLEERPMSDEDMDEEVDELFYKNKDEEVDEQFYKNMDELFGPLNQKNKPKEEKRKIVEKETMELKRRRTDDVVEKEKPAEPHVLLSPPLPKSAPSAVQTPVAAPGIVTTPAPSVVTSTTTNNNNYYFFGSLSDNHPSSDVVRLVSSQLGQAISRLQEARNAVDRGTVESHQPDRVDEKFSILNMKVINHRKDAVRVIAGLLSNFGLDCPFSDVKLVGTVTGMPRKEKKRYFSSFSLPEPQSSKLLGLLARREIFEWMENEKVSISREVSYVDVVKREVLEIGKKILGPRFAPSVIEIAGQELIYNPAGLPHKTVHVTIEDILKDDAVREMIHSTLNNPSRCIVRDLLDN